MTVLLHVAQPTDAGVARCVADLATAQRAAGLDVVVACPPGGHLQDDLRRGGVSVRTWHASRSPGPSVPGEVRRLAALVREARPDVVHLHSAKAGLAGRLALRGRVPTAFQPHAWSFDAVTGPVRTATTAWERTAARWTDLLVCVSAAERDRGRDHGVHARGTVVVPNGVDLARLLPADDDERTAARAVLGLGPGPLAVCVGRLARQKGQDVLLAAWPEVARQVLGATLALIGDGPDRAALAAAAPAGVLLAGASSQVADWYAAADVVVVPSRWEGMALTPLEAMARGRCVVASDVTGVAESVPREAGDLVPPDDPAALATAVADALADRPATDARGAAGRAHVAARHDLQRTTAQLTDAVLGLVRS